MYGTLIGRHTLPVNTQLSEEPVFVSARGTDFGTRYGDPHTDLVMDMTKYDGKNINSFSLGLKAVPV